MLFSLLGVDSTTVNTIVGIVSIIVTIAFGLPAILAWIRRSNIRQFYKVFLSSAVNNINPNSWERYHFMHYIKHSFTLEKLVAEQEDLSYNGFIKKVNKTKIVILTGSAGIGKSILMQRLALKYRSRIQKNQSGKSLDDYGILFIKLNRQYNSERIISEVEEKIKKSSIPYALFLDGLDEISDLSTKWGSEVLKDLLDKLLDGIAQKCSRIFISLRPEILNKGYSFVHFYEEENISLFKIRNFNNKQVMAMYRRESRNYGDTREKATKTKSNIRRQNLKKLKSILRNDHKKESIFTYPLILTWANAILTDCSIKELTDISWYDALGKVIDNELKREYRLEIKYNSTGTVATQYPPDQFMKNDEFINEGKEFLADIALNMALSENQRVTREDVSANPIVQRFSKAQRETTGNTFTTRRLLRYVEWSENSDTQPYYEFMHNTIYWRALAGALLDPNAPQNVRAEIILKHSNNVYSTPLMQYCYQGLWSVHRDLNKVFPYVDYLAYIRAMDNKVINYSTQNSVLPLEIILSCFYGFEQVVIDYSVKFDSNRIKEFVEERKLNLSYNSNFTDLTFLDNFSNNSFDFLDCSNSELVKAEIPDYVKKIDFYKCTSLKNITIPDSITSIEKTAFVNCASLTDVEIPDNVTYIGKDAFIGCTAIKKLTIGKSVKIIESEAFSHCTGLTEINYNATACSDLGEDSDVGPNYALFQNAGRYESGITVTIGANVTRIPVGLFAYGNSILDNDAKPPKITKVKFTKNSVCERICACAFAGCDMIESIILPDSVKSIGSNTFSKCDKLKKIHLGSGFESMVYAFPLCKSLVEISVSSDNHNYKSIDGNLYSFDGKSLVRYAPGKSENSFNVPESVTSIGDWAFSCCGNLTNIILPDSITYIGAWVFSGAAYYDNKDNWEDGVLYIGRHLIAIKNTLSKSYEIKSGTLTIAKNAFRWHSELTSIIIPDGVIGLGDYAFFECSGLMSVTIPNSITSIGERVFSKCSSLEHITYKGTVQEWNDIQKDEGIFDNTKVSEIVCTDGVVKID